jgi:uncharacterized protein (DUF433 family)
MALDWSHCPAVESIPGKMSGAWVLKGTRMPVSAIFENLEAGANIDDIMEWFDGLDREQGQGGNRVRRPQPRQRASVRSVNVGFASISRVEPHIQRVVDAVNAAVPGSYAEV